MQIAVEIKRLNISSDEISDTSKSLERLEKNIDSIRRQLLSQSGFESQTSELKKILSNFEDIHFSLYTLIQAMNGIVETYCKAELSIERGFGKC